MGWTGVAPCAPLVQDRSEDDSSQISPRPGGSNASWKDEEHLRLKKLFLEHEQRIVQAVVRSINEGRVGAYEEPTPPLQSSSSMLGGRSNLPGIPGLSELREQYSEAPDREDVSIVGSLFDAVESIQGGQRPSNFSGMQGQTSHGTWQMEETSANARSGSETSLTPRRSGISRFAQNGIHMMLGKMTLDQTEKDLDKAVEQSAKKPRQSRRGLDITAEGRARHYANRLLESKLFQAGLIFVILASAVSIGMQADFAMKHTPEATPWEILLADRFFAFCFAIELVLRILAETRTFCNPANRNFGWNVLDTFLVMFSILEEVFAAVQTRTPDMTILRVLRVFRLVRVFRIVRVARFFNDMRIMVAGIMNSMKLLIWALLLLLIIAFIFSVCLLELASLEMAAIHEQPERHTQTLAELREDFKFTWGSLLRAVYTLFQAASGGIDWGMAIEPMIALNAWMAVIFVLYISVAVFCVLNIVTGIFVENAKVMTAKDETNLTMETIANRKEWVQEVKTLWKSFTTEENGELDLETFTERVEDIRVQASFTKLGLEIHAEYIPGLFALLDFNGNGMVDIDEFAVGIQMLHGSAKSIDMARVRYNVALIKTEVCDLKEMLTERFANDPVRGSPSMAPKKDKRRPTIFAGITDMC